MTVRQAHRKGAQRQAARPSELMRGPAGAAAPREAKQLLWTMSRAEQRRFEKAGQIIRDLIAKADRDTEQKREALNDRRAPVEAAKRGK